MEQVKHTEALPGDSNTEEAPEYIHLPPPSWAPIILALGMAGVCFGVVLNPAVLVLGIVLLLMGLGVWVSDEIRHASEADAEEQQAHGA